MYGFSTKEEAVGKAGFQFISARDYEKAIESMKTILEKGSARNIEYTLLTKDGKEFLVDVSASVIRDASGEPKYIVAITRDITQRRKMETALRESEERLRQLIEFAPDAIYVNDLDGVFIDGNKQAEELTGYKKEELVGKNILNVGLIPEKSLPKIIESLQKNIQGLKSGPDEIEMVRKDGSIIIIEVSAIPVKRGEKIECLGIARNITERKKIENALRDSEAKYRLIFENVSDVIFSYDSEFKILSVSPSAEKSLGYKTDELVGKPIQDLNLLTPDSMKAALSNALRALAGERIGSIMYEFVKKDGSTAFGEVNSSPLIQDGNVVSVIAVARDITERKRMEDALRESEEKIRNILQSSPDAILVSDLNGVAIDCNQASLNVFGVARKEDLIGRSIYEFIATKDKERVLEDIVKAAEQSSIRNIEYIFKDTNGREFPAEVSASAVHDASGNPRYFVAIVEDITERKQMMKKLEEYSQQLEEMVEKRTRQLKEAQEQLVKSERLAAIGQVAAMVGHDLRNPLTGIKGAAYYLKTKPALKTDKKTMEMLELIEKDIEYSNKIITDLLEYSREVHLELTETTPRSIGSETLSLLEVPKNVEIINLTQDEPRTKVDIEKLNRVFVNLIKNAFDAMPKGGKLTIKSIRTNDNVELAFTDTGMGMTKEQMGKIWTPFFTTKAKGMGLGLPICKRIVEAHGGHISVQSMAGLGTTFTVTIPIEPKITDGGEKIWMNIQESLSSTTMKPLEQS